MSVILNNKYKLTEQLGEGTFGKVFKAIMLRKDEPVAVKIQHKDILKVLRYEAKIYKLLQSVSGVPNIRSYGLTNGYNYLVIDYAGISLSELKLKRCELVKIFSIIIKILKDIHDLGIIHRDIKPDNLLYKSDEQKVYLIDFGLSKSLFSKDNKHFEERKNRKLIGTPKYSSVNVHNGIEASRRDDLESLCYSFIALYEMHLPWEDINIADYENKEDYYKELLDKKKSQNSWLFSLPGEFITFLKYIQNLEFKETPNYEYLMGVFTNLERLHNI